MIADKIANELDGKATAAGLQSVYLKVRFDKEKLK